MMLDKSETCCLIQLALNLAKLLELFSFELCFDNFTLKLALTWAMHFSGSALSTELTILKIDL